MDEDEFNQFEEAQQNLSQRNTQPSEYSHQPNISFHQMLVSSQQGIFSVNENPSNSSINIYNNLEQFQFENGAVKQQFKVELTKTHSVYDVFDSQISMDIHRNNSLKQTPLSSNPSNSYNHIGDQVPKYQSHTNHQHYPSTNTNQNQINFNKYQPQESNYSMMNNLSNSSITNKQSQDYFISNMNTNNYNMEQSNKVNVNEEKAVSQQKSYQNDKMQIVDMQKTEFFVSYNQNMKKKEEIDEQFTFNSQVKHTVSIVTDNDKVEKNPLFDSYEQNTIMHLYQKKQSINQPEEQDFEYVSSDPKIQDQSIHQPVIEVNNIQINQNNDHYNDFNIDFVKEQVPNLRDQKNDIFSGQNKEVQIRKQSDQFVFQQSQDQQNNQLDINYGLSPAIIQETQTTLYVAQIPSNSQNDNLTKKVQEYPSNKSQQDDQFGDFQQSEPNNLPEPVTSPEIGSNIIQIKEEYINSHQGQYYASKKTQLQNFVDSLPDYSFILAQSFCI